MKKLFPLFLLLLSLNSFAQSPDTWEDKADRVAAWAERLAERAENRAERLAENWEYRAERSAENWEHWADDFAHDMERTFGRGWQVSVNGERLYGSDICQAFLGIYSDEISKDKAHKLGFDNPYGSYLTRVIEGSAADHAGLQVFDYIYGIDEQRTSNNQGLSDIIADYNPGDEVTLYFIRNGQKKTARATFGEYNDCSSAREEEAFLGIRPHDDERSRDYDGVKVEIVSNSTAEEMGMEDGDVILALNNYPVLDWSDVTTAINSFRPGEDVEVEFLRDGKKMELTAPIKGHETTSYGISNSNWDWDFDSDMQDDWDDDGAFLGIYAAKISEKKARKLGYDNPFGTLVTGVIKGTGADKAGLKPFDYIFGIDEYRVGEHQSLGGILRKFEPGDEALIHYFRKSEKQKTRLTFGSHADVEKEEKDKCQDSFFGIIQIHKESSADGVAIRTVSNSTARNMGLKEDDIITEINGYPMFDWTDISTAINMISPGETIQVTYLRDGKEYTGSDKIMSYSEAKDCDDCDCGNENFNFNFDFDWDDDVFRNRNEHRQFGHDRGSEPRVSLDDVDVKMEDINSSDADEMRGKGVDMPIHNSLTVNRLKLSPNPNIGLFELEFDLPSEGQTLVRVFNPAGRVIYEYDLGRFSGDFADNVDISQNGEGVYFLHISQDGKAFTRKIVLAKN